MDVSTTKTLTAEYWITNRRAVADDTSTLEIASNRNGITDANGLAITDIVPNERDATTTDVNYNTVFWQARVLGKNEQQTEEADVDRTKNGTEIDRIRYNDGWFKHYFEYHKVNAREDEWNEFGKNDQFVLYYLIRTEYSDMVQIDVSDWTVNDEPTDADDRHSVTYKVIVDNPGNEDHDRLLGSEKFWYRKTFTVSSVRVRQTKAENYIIKNVVLEPTGLGTPTEVNGEYQFSLDLSAAGQDDATVNIYVKPTKEKHELSYELNEGQTSNDKKYTVAGKYYPDQRIITPDVTKEHCTFDGWYTDAEFNNKWTDNTMPNHDLTLYAKFTAKETPKPEPEPENQKAKYFVLLPNRGVPKSGESQGPASYLPNADSDGGVTGRNAGNGYEGYLTEAGKAIADAKYTGYDATNGYTKIDDVGVESKYLLPPTNLGFFTATNWNGTTYPADKTNTSATNITALLGTNYKPQIAEVVWYTIKKQSDGYHVDGYVQNVDVNVTYHSNFGDAEQTKICTATTGTNYEALDYADTKLPTRENYTFGGWYTDKNCTTAYETTTLMTSLDLYAKWVPNKFDVSYFVDNVQDGETEKHDVDSTVTVKAAPTKEGYTFTGWTNIANIVTVDTTTGKFIMPAQPVRFDATFEINQYNVTYKVGTEVVYTDVYNFNSDVAIRPVPTKEGYTFSGWKIGDKDAENFKMPAHDVEIHGSYSQNTRKYTVNKHFYDEKGAEIAELASTATASGAEKALIADLYKADAANQTVDGKNYVYVPGLTKVTDNLEKLTKDVTIDLHYYLNVEGGNDTPDAWEYRLTFKVVNGEWNDGGNADRVAYVPFKDYKTGKDLEYVVVPATRIPAVGEKPNSGYHAGSWDATPVANDKVQKDTVFTYTYAKNSSGGSSGRSGGSHRKPTVTIQDEVPTGLNGDDHYAYIVGYPDKTVRPQNGITRAEVATIFFRLLTDETRNANSTKSNSYSDVAAGAWYNHAVSTLSAMGIVKGDSNGKFNPNASITRAEFAAIAARFDGNANTSAASFSDIANHWAKDEISAAANNGWITGYTDGTFRPNNRITRAEAMALVNRVLKRLPETDEDLHADMIKWSDNSDASQWYYLDVLEATNSHYYQTKENQFEKWTELRDTRDWTELEK
ncbi:S-layer homology domain-containing protein [Agathobaculum sp.]|uniref:S-layer homology domain-containing protein n=1 Tax=Agathobaculum sp. TaxID=2048138 RepID=UPI003AEFE9C9